MTDCSYKSVGISPFLGSVLGIKLLSWNNAVSPVPFH